MFNLKNLFIWIILMGIITTSCKKDGEMFVIREGTPLTGLSASSSELVLTEDIESDTVVTFNWEAARFGNKVPVTYALQFTLPPDTSGSNAWGEALEMKTASNALKYGVIAGTLNSFLLSKELSAGTAHEVAVRVKATAVSTNTSVTSPVAPLFSSPITIKVTPFSGDILYTSFLWVPGNYQGWDPAAAPQLVSVKSDGVFEGYVNIAAGEFKLTAQPGWEPMAYGDGGNGNLIEANFAGGNFLAASSGYYLLYANINTMKYSFVKTSWGIIGDATPTGWNSDTDLVYDAASKKWSVTIDLTNTGSFKFRANDGWSLDFGIKDGKMVYANHPVYPYDATVGNFSVSQSGNYTITLDLSKPGNYKYKIVKN